MTPTQLPARSLERMRALAEALGRKPEDMPIVLRDAGRP